MKLFSKFLTLFLLLLLSSWLFANPSTSNLPRKHNKSFLKDPGPVPWGGQTPLLNYTDSRGNQAEITFDGVWNEFWATEGGSWQQTPLNSKLFVIPTLALMAAWNSNGILSNVQVLYGNGDILTYSSYSWEYVDNPFSFYASPDVMIEDNSSLNNISAVGIVVAYDPSYEQGCNIYYLWKEENNKWSNIGDFGNWTRNDAIIENPVAYWNSDGTLKWLTIEEEQGQIYDFYDGSTWYDSIPWGNSTVVEASYCLKSSNSKAVIVNNNGSYQIWVEQNGVWEATALGNIPWGSDAVSNLQTVWDTNGKLLLAQVYDNSNGGTYSYYNETSSWSSNTFNVNWSTLKQLSMQYTDAVVNYDSNGNPLILLGLVNGSVVFYNGATWSSIPSNGESHPVTKLEINNLNGTSSPDFVAGYSDGKIYHYQSSGLWVDLKSPVSGSSVQNLDAGENNGVFYCGAVWKNGIFEHYDDTAKGWTLLINPDDSQCAISYSDMHNGNVSFEYDANLIQWYFSNDQYTTSAYSPQSVNVLFYPGTKLYYYAQGGFWIAAGFGDCSGSLGEIILGLDPPPWTPKEDSYLNDSGQESYWENWRLTAFLLPDYMVSRRHYISIYPDADGRPIKFVGESQGTLNIYDIKNHEDIATPLTPTNIPIAIDTKWNSSGNADYIIEGMDNGNFRLYMLSTSSNFLLIDLVGPSKYISGCTSLKSFVSTANSEAVEIFNNADGTCSVDRYIATKNSAPAF